MNSLLNALKDTPIPTILVVAGVFFLILAISEQIAGKVVIDPSRRRQAIVFELLLLGSGITLQVIPKPTASPPQPTPAIEKPVSEKPASPPIQKPSEPQQLPAKPAANLMRPEQPAPAPNLLSNDSISAARDVSIGSTTNVKLKSGQRRYFKFSTTDQVPAKIRRFA